MKPKYFLFFTSVVLLIVLTLSGCVTNECSIRIRKLDVTPEEYFVITEEQMESFPHLKESIGKEDIIRTPCEESNELFDLLGGPNNIKYMNEFYEIHFGTT